MINLRKNTEFDGQVLRIFVPPDDGTEISVNSEEDLVWSEPAQTPMPGQLSRELTFLKENDAGVLVAHALLSWNPEDSADYLAFGWLVDFPDQQLPDISFEESVQYAAIDGTELDHGIVPVPPADGTASYTGQVGGIYSYTFGSDRGEAECGFVIDEFEGVLVLISDFADGAVRGCICCIGDLVTRRAHFEIFLGLDRRICKACQRIAKFTLRPRSSGKTGSSSAAGWRCDTRNALSPLLKGTGAVRPQAVRTPTGIPGW